MKINKILKLLLLCTFFIGCNQQKKEDKKIRKEIVGLYFIEDKLLPDGTFIKDYRGEFLNNGDFWEEVTYENFENDPNETSSMTIKLKGRYTIKDKKIILNYDFNSVEISPDYFNKYKDELIKSIRDKNDPQKVIGTDNSKIILQGSDSIITVLNKINLEL